MLLLFWTKGCLFFPVPFLWYPAQPMSCRHKDHLGPVTIPTWGSPRSLSCSSLSFKRMSRQPLHLQLTFSQGLLYLPTAAGSCVISLQNTNRPQLFTRWKAGVELMSVSGRTEMRTNSSWLRRKMGLCPFHWLSLFLSTHLHALSLLQAEARNHPLPRCIWGYLHPCL